MRKEGRAISELGDLLHTYVDKGAVPGAVALVARPDRVEAHAVGLMDVERDTPMARDAIFWIASLSKPITAAAVLRLVDDGRLTPDDPIERWLPELAAPMVVRTPSSPIDDVVPASRPITVFDLLTSRAGYGFPADFSLPAVRPLLDQVQRHIQDPWSAPAADEWLAELARIPLLHQPGEAFLYNTCSDLQGVLIARVSGQPLPEFLAERLFEPLGMVDTGFSVPADRLDRIPSQYQPEPTGELVPRGRPDQRWTRPPAFPSGAGGLLSTADDWLAFARMLLAEGSVDGRTVLSAKSVRLMMTDHLTPAQRDAGRLFLEGQGWGFGGSVDVATVDPWNLPGRYGWVGGSGTAAHLIPATGTVTILLTQVMMTSPAPTPLMRDFWRCTARIG